MGPGLPGLTPANQYNIDYSLLGTSRIEPLLRDIRNGMFGAGLVVESAKGECNLGQHEIAFKFDEVIRTGDQHSIYKNGAKEIAAHHGKALTFMAKFDQREGNSCHIHMSLRGDDGRIVFDEGDGPTPMFQSFVAGIQATMCELTFLYAPNINSYKRFQPGSFAPTSTAWGYDNRTCSLRVVGHGAGLRLENRLPGGDVNPYLAMAGMLGSGLRASSSASPWSLPSRATPTPPTTRACRHRCSTPATCSPASPVARELLGDAVVDHYTTTPTWSLPPSVPPSPTGNDSAVSRGM